MQLHGYDIDYDGYITELTDGLSSENILALHTSLRTLGYRGWIGWLFANYGRSADFLGSSDAERKRILKACPSEDERGFLQFGAIWIAQLAGGVSFDHPAMNNKKGSRLRRADRGRVCLQSAQLFLEGMVEWPFDEPEDNPLNAQ